MAEQSQALVPVGSRPLGRLPRGARQMSRPGDLDSRLDVDRQQGEGFSYQYDPEELQVAQDFMEGMRTHSRYSTYALRQMALSPWASCILSTRCNQIASFSLAREDPYGLGHQIAIRGRSNHSPTPAERKEIERVESLLQTSGTIKEPHEVFTRPSFDDFLRALAYDSLVLDAGVFEVVPDEKGVPHRWHPADAGLIYRVRPQNPFGDYDKADAQFCQIHHDTPTQYFAPGELCFGIRRPRTDVRSNGYGHPELTEMLEVMSGLLFGFTHNLNWFRQGGPRGMLAVMGPMHPQKFRALQRSLMFMARGVQNAWRMVVANPQGEGADVKWVPFGVSNKEMEFAEWINACFRLMCSLWQIDATEVGFYYASEGNRGAMFESSPEAKLKAGKDKGLRPLATAISSWINKFIVHRLNPDLELEFLGLGAMTEKERAELSKTLVESSRTVDEVRALDNMGKDPNGLGNLILNPQYITAYNAQQAQKQQAAMMAQQGQGGPGGPMGPGGPGGAGQPGADAQGEGAPAPGGDDWANDPLPDGGDVSGGFADEQAGEAAKSLVRAYSWVL